MRCASLALSETEHPFSAVSEFPRVHELSTLDTSLPAAAAAADDASEGERLSAVFNPQFERYTYRARLEGGPQVARILLLLVLTTSALLCLQHSPNLGITL